MTGVLGVRASLEVSLQDFFELNHGIILCFLLRYTVCNILNVRLVMRKVLFLNVSKYLNAFSNLCSTVVSSGSHHRPRRAQTPSQAYSGGP